MYSVHGWLIGSQRPAVSLAECQSSVLMPLRISHVSACSFPVKQTFNVTAELSEVNSSSEVVIGGIKMIT